MSEPSHRARTAAGWICAGRGVHAGVDVTRRHGRRRRTSPRATGRRHRAAMELVPGDPIAGAVEGLNRSVLPRRGSQASTGAELRVDGQRPGQRRTNPSSRTPQKWYRYPAHSACTGRPAATCARTAGPQRLDLLLSSSACSSETATGTSAAVSRRQRLVQQVEVDDPRRRRQQFGVFGVAEGEGAPAATADRFTGDRLTDRRRRRPRLRGDTAAGRRQPVQVDGPRRPARSSPTQLRAPPANARRPGSARMPGRDRQRVVTAQHP